MTGDAGALAGTGAGQEGADCCAMWRRSSPSIALFALGGVTSSQPIRLMCRCLKASVSGFQDWPGVRSTGAHRTARLLDKVRAGSLPGQCSDEGLPETVRASVVDRRRYLTMA